MTESSLRPTIEFMAKLRKIDRSGLKVRDVIVLWAIREQPGMMGRTLAMKIGVESRSNVQDQIARLILYDMIEDRRPAHDRRTPNDLHILPKGQEFLAALQV